MSTRRTPLFRVLAIVLLVAACGSSGASASPLPRTGATPTAGAPTSFPPSAEPTFANPWLADLDRLDRHVRVTHVSPFTIHQGPEWVAKLAEVGPKLASAKSDDERLVLLASVEALLDTHSYLWRKEGLHEYPVFVYHFTEGWFVVAALDTSLIGSRLVSIGGHEVAEVEATLRKLVSYDNEMGFLLNAQGIFSNVEYLHGAGIVADTAKPQYVLGLPDGAQRTVDFAPLGEQEWADSLHLLGLLVGDETEAVRRHAELSWSRVAPNKVFLLTVNDYGDENTVIAALKAALDAGTADRVVLDIRFLPGGNGDFGVINTLKNDPRVNRPRGLTVLMGRENFSVATLIVRELDTNTHALLVGEPTPARADNFRCPCQDIELSAFDAVVTVPTFWGHVGDDRAEIDPDVRMDLTAADFFAGRDPVLAAALKGIPVP